MYDTVILILLVTCILRYSAGTQFRVFNGYTDTTSSNPYVVVLMGKSEKGRRLCTGSLISPSWVLTAAHCLVKVLTYIQYGDVSVPFNITKTKSKIVEKIPHPRYAENALSNDIALFRVTPVVMDFYGRVLAADYTTLPGLPVQFAGFGLTFLNSAKPSFKKTQLKTSNLVPLQIGHAVVKNCEHLYKNYICVQPKCSYSQYSTFGDSGGPIFFEQKIAGVLSGMPFKDKSERFYTPVSPYLTWIQRVITETEN